MSLQGRSRGILTLQQVPSPTIAPTHKSSARFLTLLFQDLRKLQSLSLKDLYQVNLSQWQRARTGKATQDTMGASSSRWCWWCSRSRNRKCMDKARLTPFLGSRTQTTIGQRVLLLLAQAVLTVILSISWQPNTTTTLSNLRPGRRSRAALLSRSCQTATRLHSIRRKSNYSY